MKIKTNELEMVLIAESREEIDFIKTISLDDQMRLLKMLWNSDKKEMTIR